MTRNNDYSISLWKFYKLQTDHTLSAPIYLSKIQLILQGLSQCPALPGYHVIISVSLHCKLALPVLLSSEGTTIFCFVIMPFFCLIRCHDQWSQEKIHAPHHGQQDLQYLAPDNFLDFILPLSHNVYSIQPRWHFLLSLTFAKCSSGDVYTISCFGLVNSSCM